VAADSLTLRLRRILTSYIEPPLKSLGFRRRGANYFRQLSEIWWLVSVQRSRWNTKEELSFTLNIGIYVPQATAGLYGNQPKHPGIADCILHLRLGYLQHPVDCWWTLCVADAVPAAVDEAVGQEIQELLVNHGLPFLERFHTHRDVLGYFKELSAYDLRILTFPKSAVWIFVNMGVLHWLLGEYDLCCRSLTQALNEVQRGRAYGIQDFVESVFYRLCKEYEQK